MIEPRQTWWSAAEIAASGLPDAPTTKRGVTIMAKREGWDAIPGKVRRRKAAGGGMEYHWTVLPLRARMRLLQHAETPAMPEAPEVPDRDSAWADYAAAKDRAKAEAQKRLEALDAVDAFVRAGLTRYLATEEVARQIKVSSRTIWNWHEAVEGIARADRLPYLVPRQGLVTRKRRTDPVNPEFFAFIKSAYLSPSQPNFTDCYAWGVEDAEARGLPIAPIHQVRRLYKTTVSKPTELFWRKGAEALRRYFPHQTRDKSAMVPLECVQGDYHKFDVFVRWPGEAKPVRPQVVVFSDVYSGKVLSWRLDLTANSHTVQLAIGDLISRYGIPQSFLLDNGREFAAKAITGGTPTRFRFKITDEDIPGLIPLVGAKVLWATPYSGQSKPIERSFREFCDTIAKHPAFEGAYTGNAPDAKPENYGNRAIPLDEFRAVVARGIERFNARPDRRSPVAFGRSFNEVFNEGYKTAPIRKPTAEQRRLWLLRAEGVRANAKNGEIALYNSRYWSDWGYRIAGQKVVARFDPENIYEGVEVYDLDGAYLGFMQLLVKGGFNSVADAREHQRKQNTLRKAAKAEAQAAKEFSAAEIAARLSAAGQDVTPDTLPEAEVLRMPTPHKAAPRRAATRDETEADAAFEVQILKLEARRAEAARELDDDEAFEAAMQFEAMLADGVTLTPDQSAWLEEYRQSAAYKGRVRVARSSFTET